MTKLTIKEWVRELKRFPQHYQITLIENFNPEEFESKELIRVIISELDHRNYLYVSELIYLSERLSLCDSKLTKKFADKLFANPHTIVKLSIIDYFSGNSDNFSKSLIQLFEAFLETRQFTIVKNQALIALILFNPESKERYFKKIISNLLKHNNYRVPIRVLNSISNFNINLSLEEIEQLLGSIEAKNNPLSVVEAINRFKAKVDATQLL